MKNCNQLYEKNIKIMNEDIADRLYFISSMAQKQNGHAMFSTLNSRGDLIGGIFDRWVNTIPDNILFDKIILPFIDNNNQTKIIKDFYSYDPRLAGIAPDVIGIKVKGKVVPFVIYDNHWKPVENMPQIEVKTYKENQKMVSLRNQNYEDEYLIMAESAIRIDYLIPFINPKYYDKNIYNEMISDDNAFIKNNSNELLSKFEEINNTNNEIGTVRILKIMTMNDFMKYSTFCESTVSPQYIISIDESKTKSIENAPLSHFVNETPIGLFKFNENWYSGVKNGIPTLKNGKLVRTLDIKVLNIDNIHIIKRNLSNAYIKTSGDAQINNYNLIGNKIYKISFQLLDRSSNDGEEYFMQKSIVNALPDYADELCNKLKDIINKN